jgi:hypothetical protein
MSGTHVTRSVGELDLAGLVRVEAQEVVILDAGRLAAFCGYVAIPEPPGRRAVI